MRQRRPNTDRKDRKNGGEIEREIGESVATVPPRTERERERGANTPTRRERILAKSSSRHTPCTKALYTTVFRRRDDREGATGGETFVSH